MTVQQLIALIDDMYGNAVSDTSKISYMNMAQNELSPYFGLIAIDSSLTSLADDDEYTLPTGIDDITQIEYLEIATQAPQTATIVASADMKVGTYTIAAQPPAPRQISVTVTATGTADTMGTVTIAGTVGGSTDSEAITPVAGSTVYGTKFFSAVTTATGAGWVIDAVEGTADKITIGVSADRYDYTRYYPYTKDFRTNRNNNFYSQNYSSAGVKTLILYPAPTLSNLVINIRYHKKLTDLSATSLTSSPVFDSRFHDMLALFACWMICSTQASPDSTQANRFLQSYKDRMDDYWKLKLEDEVVFPRANLDNKQWRR
jgi:hypothetical protein